MTKVKKDKKLSDAQLDSLLNMYEVPAHSDDMERRIMAATGQKKLGTHAIVFWRQPRFAIAFVVLICACAAMLSVYHQTQRQEMPMIMASAEESVPVEAFLEETIDKDLEALEYAIVMASAEDSTGAQQQVSHPDTGEGQNQSGDANAETDDEIEDFLDEILGIETRML
jgi:hypothetical protein